MCVVCGWREGVFGVVGRIRKKSRERSGREVLLHGLDTLAALWV